MNPQMTELLNDVEQRLQKRAVSIGMLPLAGGLLVFLLLLSIAGGLAYRWSQNADAMIAAAMVNESKYKTRAALADLEKAALRKQNDVLSKKQTETKVRIVTRVIERNAQIQYVQAEPENDEKFLNKTAEILGERGLIEPTNRISFSRAGVTSFMVTRIERDAFEADSRDLKALFEMEEKKTANLNTMLIAEEARRKDAEKLYVEYKKAAQATKKQKIWKAVRFVGAVAATGFVAYKIGQHTGSRQEINVITKRQP